MSTERMQYGNWLSGQIQSLLVSQSIPFTFIELSINTSFSQFSSFVRPSATSSVPSIRTGHCNRGFYLHGLKRSDFHCFCPPSYYGDRCQFDRRRVTLLLRFDRWIRQDIPWSINVLVTLVHNKTRIVDHQFSLDIVRDQSYKHHLYLLYPRPRLAGSYFVRIEACHSVELLFLWEYSLSPFEFLLVFRLAKVLRFPSILRPLQCRENHCRNNGTCYRTPSEHSICLCLPEWHGQLCEKQSRPSRCAANFLVRDENICICPRGYLLPNCFVHNRRCEQPMSCSANQMCSPISRQPPNGFLCSPNRSEGHPRHSQLIIGRNESNSLTLLLQLLKIFDDYFLIRQQILLSPKTNFPLQIPFRASHLFDKTNLSSFIALIWIFHPFRNSIDVNSSNNPTFPPSKKFQHSVNNLHLINCVFLDTIIFAFAIHQPLDRVHVFPTINDPLHVHIVITEVSAFEPIWTNKSIRIVFVRNVRREICANILRVDSPFPSNISSKRPVGVSVTSSFPLFLFFSVGSSMVFVSSPSSFLDLVKLERVFIFSSLL